MWKMAGADPSRATGTPPGVGMARSPQRFLKKGDKLRLGIAGLGDPRRLGPIGGRTIGLFALTTLIAEKTDRSQSTLPPPRAA